MQPPRDELPDDTSRTEDAAVSTGFDPGTARRVKTGAGIAVALLFLGFFAVEVIRYFDERTVAQASETAYSTAPPVDVVVARAASVGQDLVLPGQTAAWYETTIYARVNGYVAKWLVDIGEHVKKGQALATIETPELDAELAAAEAQLKASRAQVGARKAEAALFPSRSVNPKKRIMKVRRHGCLRPALRSRSTNRGSISTAH